MPLIAPAHRSLDLFSLQFSITFKLCIMSKIVAIFEEPITRQDYDTILAELKAIGEFPQVECLSHTAFQKDNNWCVVDVWSSEEAFMNFGKNTLMPVFQKLGLAVGSPKIFAVHNYTGVEETTSA